MQLPVFYDVGSESSGKCVEGIIHCLESSMSAVRRSPLGSQSLLGQTYHGEIN